MSVKIYLNSDNGLVIEEANGVIYNRTQGDLSAKSENGRIEFCYSASGARFKDYAVLDVSNALGVTYGSYAAIISAISDFFVDAALAAAEQLEVDLGVEVQNRTSGDANLQNQINTVASGYLGAIAYNAAAPKPAKNGWYDFSTGGVVSWITGTPTVKIGDRVSVLYTAPSTYVYTYQNIDISGILADNSFQTFSPIWDPVKYMYNKDIIYSDATRIYGCCTGLLSISKITASAIKGYTLKVRQYNPTTNTFSFIVPVNNTYSLSDGNTVMQLGLNNNDLFTELPVSNIPNVLTITGYLTGAFYDSINKTNILDDLSRTKINYSWAMTSASIVNGTVTALVNKSFTRIFIVPVKEGNYYKYHYNGQNEYSNFCSYSFFDNNNLSVGDISLEGDSLIAKGFKYEIEKIVKAPMGAKIMAFCIQCTSTTNMVINGSYECFEYSSKELISIDSQNSINPLMIYNSANETYDYKLATKKVGLIVAGQSNTAGRCLKADIPAGIVDGNFQIPNCHLKGVLSTRGKYYDNIPFDGIYTLQNVWAYDAIVYKKLSDILNAPFYVAKWAIGDTAIADGINTNGCWQPDFSKYIGGSTNSSLLLSLRTTINAIITAQPDVEFKAMLWHQGEGDMQSVASAIDYYTNFKAVIWFIRGIVKNPNLAVVFGTISHLSAQYSALIEEAQIRLANEDEHIYCVDMSTLTLLDPYHFDATSASYLGQSMFDILKEKVLKI